MISLGKKWSYLSHAYDRVAGAGKGLGLAGTFGPQVPEVDHG